MLRSTMFEIIDEPKRFDSVTQCDPMSSLFFFVEDVVGIISIVVAHRNTSSTLIKVAQSVTAGNTSPINPSPPHL
ncbi:hypothetical protein J6590_103076 [Homalodisca vitripennis]|nr:hypothetical protein J6590_103076 [Homalodisca vitripennis]